MSTLALLAGVSAIGTADAGNILIVNGSSTTSETGTTQQITDNLSSLETQAGNVPSIVDTVPGSLAGFQQIWDIRFSNSSPLTTPDQTQYLGFLQGGNGMFVMGENASFPTRNNSVFQFVSLAGGGQIGFAEAEGLQQVLPPANAPNPVDSFEYQAPGGLSGAGTGQCLTRDADGICSAVAFGVGSLANAPTGSLTVVMDVNFMQPSLEADPTNFLKNLIKFVTQQAEEGGGGGNGSDFTTFADTPYQRAVAEAFNTLFGQTSAELSQVMLGVATAPNPGKGLERAGNSFLDLPLDTAFQATNKHYSHVLGWLDATPSLSGANLQLLGYGEMDLKAAHSADLPLPVATNGEDVNVYFNASYLGGSHDASTNQAGYDYNGAVLSGGFTYAVNPVFTVGAAGGWTQLNSDVDDGRGDGTTKVFNGLAFGSFKKDGFYGDLVGSVGHADYDYSRNISINGVNLRADGDTDGVQYGFAVRTGYDFKLLDDSQNAIVGGPFAQLKYLHQDYDAYDESGAGNASLEVDEQSAKSLTGRIGGRVRGIVTAGAIVYTPSLALAYEREFEDDSRSVTNAFAGGPAAPFSVPIDEGDKDFAVVELGLGAQFTPKVGLSAAYEGRVGSDDRQHAFTARLTAKF